MIKENCDSIKEKLEKIDDFAEILIYNFDIYSKGIEQINNENMNNKSLRQSQINKIGFNINNSQIIDSSINAAKFDLYNNDQKNNSDEFLNNKLEKLDIGIFENYTSIQHFIFTEIRNLNQSRNGLDNLKVN